MRTHLLIFMVAAATGACAVDAADDGLIEPSFDSKSDMYTDLADGEPIELGGTVTGAFDRDFQFFAYRFAAREGSVISAEVARRGSSSRLDTVLWLYRLADAAPVRLVYDDDDGFGALSKISELELYSEDEYALVVGTKSAAGRGHFTLALTCDSGDCAPDVTEPACPLTAQAELMRCMEGEVPEWDFEAELSEIVANACGTTDDVSFYEGVTDATTNAACVTWGQRAYPPTADRTRGFLREAAEPSIDAIVTRVNGSEACSSGDDWGCEFQLKAFEYDTDFSITVEELMSHARLQFTPGPGLFPVQQTGEEAEAKWTRFLSRYDIAADVASLADLLGGSFSHARYGSFSGDDVQWNYGDCGGESVVVDFFEEGLAFELTVFYCSG